MLKLLRGAELYAPERQGIRDVLVAGESVVWVGECEAPLPTGVEVEVVDLGGLRVVPGFIDAHVHTTGGGGEAGYASRVPPVPVERFTTGGVTTVVGVLGTDDIVRHPGELLAHTRALVERGIDAYCHAGGYHVPPVTLTGSIRSDLVHIDRMIGVGEIAISDHRSSQPTLDELLRIASDAHVAGLMTGKAGIVHLHVGDGARGLDLIRRALESTELPARVFNPTHVNRRKALFDEAVEILDRGVSIDITAFPVGPEEDAWSAEDAIERVLEQRGNLSGVTVTSDGGGCLPTFDQLGRVDSMEIGAPGALALTLRALTRRGHSLESVLPAFTREPATLLRLDDKGRLGPGSAADLVVLDDESRVRDVLARGRWHVRDGRPRIVEPLSWNTDSTNGTDRE